MCKLSGIRHASVFGIILLRNVDGPYLELAAATRLLSDPRVLPRDELLLEDRQGSV